MSQDITVHYELVEGDGVHIFHTLADAHKAADHNPDRVWFVRHGDGSECDCDPDGDEMDCECEEVWDVELYHGQFVNKAGFFVTSEPCKPEHRNTVFTY